MLWVGLDHRSAWSSSTRLHLSHAGLASMNIRLKYQVSNRIYQLIIDILARDLPLEEFNMKSMFVRDVLCFKTFEHLKVLFVIE